MPELNIKDYEDFAGHILSSPSWKESKEKDEILKDDIALINDFIKSVKKEDFSLANSETVQKALAKSQADIFAYINQFLELIKRAEADIKKVDIEEIKIDDYNQKQNAKKYQLQNEIKNLGFFSGAKKKELQAEIDGLQFKKKPPELDEERERLNKVIEQFKAHIEPFSDKIKGVNYYQMDAERKQYKPEEAAKQTQGLAQGFQKPIQPIKLNELKEVSAPKLKPLKRK